MLNEQPCPRVSAAVFWEYLIGQMLLAGDALAEIQRGRGGAIHRLIPLDSRAVAVRDVNGRLRYEFMREAVWRFFGAAISSVIFGPIVAAAVHSVWPSLLSSAHALAADDGIGFTALYFTAPVQIASGLPIWWLLGLGARWMDSNRSLTLSGLFNDLLHVIA